MTRGYFRPLSCLILVYSTDLKSMEDLEDWVGLAKTSNTSDSDIMYSLWSIDLNDTSKEENDILLLKIRSFAHSHGIDSALCFRLSKDSKFKDTNTFVVNAFNTTLNELIKVYSADVEDSNRFAKSDKSYSNVRGTSVQAHTQTSLSRTEEEARQDAVVLEGGTVSIEESRHQEPPKTTTCPC